MGGTLQFLALDVINVDVEDQERNKEDRKIEKKNNVNIFPENQTLGHYKD